MDKAYPILLFFSLIIISDCSNSYYFSRTLQCIDKQPSAKSCRKWSETGYLISDWDWSNCFPGTTYVLGQDGPIQMKSLKIGDMIYSFNPKSQKRQFTKVLGWLHRDQTSLFQYNQIKTEDNFKYFASQFHNIGYEQQGKIFFKFLNELKMNDSLILNNGSTVKVVAKDSKKELQGLYSPITENGLFYINPTGSSDHQGRDNMILVHSLSQIKNPIENFEFTLIMLDIIGLFHDSNIEGLQQYVHPLMNHFSFLYGSDWVDHKSKVKHQAANSNNGAYRRMIRKISMIKGLQIQILDTILT